MTRPCLDYYLATKYQGYLTKGMSELELEDFSKAQEDLEKYN